jgi:hypothetical protein
MAKHKYRIASQEGADRYRAEVGAETELDLDREEQRAVVAAGWVEPLDSKEETPRKDASKQETKEA